MALPERRQAARRRTLLGGTIRSLCKTRTLTCKIRNLSGTGARLEIANATWLPDRFELDIPHHDLRLGAKVAWRAEQALGVIFAAPEATSGTSIREQTRVSILQAERDLLALRVRRLTDEL